MGKKEDNLIFFSSLSSLSLSLYIYQESGTIMPLDWLSRQREAEVGQEKRSLQEEMG